MDDTAPDDIAEPLARRDRFRRHRWRTLTPEQRVQEMVRLQQRSWDLLQMNPAGYRWWLRRNMAAWATREGAGAA